MTKRKAKAKPRSESGALGKSDEESPGCYQVRQPPEAGIIGSPFLQPKALPNSSKFCTVPLTRHSPVECGLVLAWLMAACCVSVPHQTCAKEMKKRWSAV